MSHSSKLEYITQIRVLSLFLIVFYHCICFYLGKWGLPCADGVSALWSSVAPSLVNVGLTQFVLISGFLYGYFYRKGKYHNFLPFIKGKAMRLLVPYFVWSLFIIYLIPGSGHGLKGMLYGIAHLWFLLMLFEVFFVVAILNIKGFIDSSSKVIDALTLVLSVLPLVITKYVLDLHFPLAFELTMKYLPVFLLGIYAAKYTIFEKIPTSVMIGLMLLGGGILSVATRRGVDLNNELYTYASCCIAIPLMSFVKKNSVTIKFFSWLGDSCMGIYLLNQIVIYYLLLNDSFRLFANRHEYIAPLVIFVISFGVPLLITKVLVRFKWSRYIIG